MLAGLRSRWTMPCSCRKLSPLPISRRKKAVFCVPSPAGASSSSCRSDGPATYSMITNGRFSTL
jgi:hypothetical protein